MLSAKIVLFTLVYILCLFFIVFWYTRILSIICNLLWFTAPDNGLRGFPGLGIKVNGIMTKSWVIWTHIVTSLTGFSQYNSNYCTITFICAFQSTWHLNWWHATKLNMTRRNLIKCYWNCRTYNEYIIFTIFEPNWILYSLDPL